MLNTANFIIDLNGMGTNFTQMKNAIEVAVKAALANTTEVVTQMLIQAKTDNLHVKTDGIEVVVVKGKIMFLTKNVKLTAMLLDFEGMDYSLESFSLHKQTELLNAVLELGYLLEDGKLTIDTDFHSDGLELASVVLNSLNNNNKQFNILFNGCKINIKENEVLIDNKIIFQNGVLYFNEYYCKVLIDLFSKTTRFNHKHKYDVLNGCKSNFSNNDCKNE